MFTFYFKKKLTHTEWRLLKTPFRFQMILKTGMLLGDKVCEFRSILWQEDEQENMGCFRGFFLCCLPLWQHDMEKEVANPLGKWHG